MTTHRRLIHYLMALFFLLVVGSKSVQAEGMGYSVRAIIPDNQLDQTKTYFDLKVQPGDTQKLALEITSTSSEELHLKVSPHSATTNQNGELEFSVEPTVHDSTLEYPMTELISASQSVTLAPKETKQVSFTLKVPEDSFAGKLVGGFTIYDQANDKEVEASGKKEVQIRNVFSMVVGIQLQEKSQEIKPELKLNGVKANLFNYRTAMTANLQNTQPTFLSQLKVAAIIKQAGSKKVLYETEKQGMTMAPNSNFDFPIMLENQEIKPGNYVMELQASSGKETWTVTKKFKVSKEEASELNKSAVELEARSTDSLVYLNIILVILVLVVGSVMIYLSLRK